MAVFLPGSVLILAGGALFGPVMGVFYNLTAVTIGATLSFLTARYLTSDWVAKNQVEIGSYLLNKSKGLGIKDLSHIAQTFCSNFRRIKGRIVVLHNL